MVHNGAAMTALLWLCAALLHSDLVKGQVPASQFNTTCTGHDFPCVGTHGTQSTCCQGLYCHKSVPTWAEGRCYHGTAHSPHPGSQTATCSGHDISCVGGHGTQSTCCEGLYCHKSDPSWALGRCYYGNVHQGGQAATCNGHDQTCVGAHGTQSTCCQGLYCHKSDPNWQLGRCYYGTSTPESATSTTSCNGHDQTCEGVHRTQSNCCQGLYCHKPNPQWALGRCYYGGTDSPGDLQRAESRRPQPVPSGSTQ